MTSRILRPIGTAVCAALLTPSCNTVVSRTPGDPEYASRSSSKIGLHYHLPKARVKITGKYTEVYDPAVEKPKPEDLLYLTYDISLSKANVADPNARVFSEITTNAMFTEDTKLKVVDGLLDSAHSKPQDQTGNVLVSLANTAIYAAKIMANFGGLPGGPVQQGNEDKIVAGFRVEFDPANAKEVQDALDIIEKAGFAPNAEGLPVSNQRGSSALGGMKLDGLVYRKPRAFNLTLTVKDEWKYKDKIKPGTQRIHYGSLTVPDTSADGLAFLPMKRIFMGKRDTVVVMAAGEPVEINLTQDSPVLNFVKVPEQIAKAASDAVPDIIKVNNAAPTNAVSAQNALIEQQIKAYQNQKALLEAQQAAAEAQKKAAEAAAGNN